MKFAFYHTINVGVNLPKTKFGNYFLKEILKNPHGFVQYTMVKVMSDRIFVVLDPTVLVSFHLHPAQHTTAQLRS